MTDNDPANFRSEISRANHGAVLSRVHILEFPVMSTRSLSNLMIKGANSFEISFLRLTLNLTKKTALPERLQSSLRFSVEFVFDVNKTT